MSRGLGPLQWAIMEAMPEGASLTTRQVCDLLPDPWSSDSATTVRQVHRALGRLNGLGWVLKASDVGSDPWVTVSTWRRVKLTAGSDRAAELHRHRSRTTGPSET